MTSDIHVFFAASKAAKILSEILKIQQHTSYIVFTNEAGKHNRAGSFWIAVKASNKEASVRGATISSECPVRTHLDP